MKKQEEENDKHKKHEQPREAEGVADSDECGQSPSRAEDRDQWHDRFLRVSADFQNFKRRVESDRASWVSTAQIEVVKRFLPLLDDLERALMSSASYEFAGDMKTWLEGFSMIQKNLTSTLRDLEVEEIDCSGAFDPKIHEALMHVDAPDVESGNIVEVLKRGYRFKEVIVRPAQVSVAR